MVRSVNRATSSELLQDPAHVVVDIFDHAVDSRGLVVEPTCLIFTEVAFGHLKRAVRRVVGECSKKRKRTAALLIFVGSNAIAASVST